MNFLLKLMSIFHRERLDADMAEEMRAHLERRTLANLAAGMSADDARYAAQRQFGGVDQLKEVAREQRGWLWLEHLVRDVRFALRQLAKSPGFTLVAVLSLGLGIGACTAVFTLVNSVLLNSLPVPNPQELRVLHWTGTDPRIRSLSDDTHTVGPRITADAVSASMFFRLREKGAELADIFGFFPLDDIAVRVRREAFATGGMLVSDNFFSGLGARAFMGRLFAPGAAETEGEQQLVITAGWWEKHFASDPGVLGQTIMLNSTPFTIIGVLPREFPGVRPGDPREFYALLTPQSPLFERPASVNPNDHWWVRMMARLRPAGSDAQLKASLDLVFSLDAAAQMKAPEILVAPGGGGQAFDRNAYRQPLLLMLSVVGLVMLVACANLAGLSLARGAARHHELAVRAALGAGRWRLLRQSLTESGVLALLGGVLGVLLAVWGKAVLSRLLAGTAEGLHHDLSLNFTVLGFTLGVAFVTALASGVLPALQASRVDPRDGLRARGALGATRLRAGKILIVVQVALSLLLLTGSGLYLRTLVNLRGIDAGFNAEKLLVVELNAAAAGFTPAQATGFYEQVQNALADLPGVQSATVMMHPLLGERSWSGGVTFPGRATAEPSTSQAHRQIVGETYFATMGIPVLQGRAFSAADAEDAPPVLVVNEAFAKKYFPGEDPLGQRVNPLRGEWRIVGVCRDTKYRSLKEPAPPTVYFSYRQFPLRYGASFALRTALPPLGLATAVRSAVAAINPQVPVARITTQERLRDAAIAPERLAATLCGGLAGLALLLACIGLYGLMAFNVARRTNEIAIRMAIGAQSRDVAWPILREALWLAVTGIAIGLPVALAVARLVKNQLYGVPPNDPATLAAVIAALVIATLAAAWFPARRATRVHPSTALRAE